MKTHHLKILPKYYRAVADGRKTYEVRHNDRNFAFGDTVILQEWNIDSLAGVWGFDPQVGVTNKVPGYYTGKELAFKVGYIFDIDQDTVVFSLLPLDT